MIKQATGHDLHLPTLLLALLAFSLPFELDRPLLQFSAIAITNLELILGLIIIAFLFDHPTHKLATIPRHWLLLLALFTLGGLLSAFFAPTLRANALKAMLRTLMGISLMLITATTLTTRRQLKIILSAIVLGVLLTSFFGLIELATGSSPAFLHWFRPRVSLAGPFMRLTGSFDYANQTAMSLEIAVLLCLGLLVSLGKNKAHHWQIGLFIITCLLQTALILTFSRAALLTIIALIGLTFLLSIKQPTYRKFTLLLTISFVLPTSILLLTSEVLRLRLTTSNEQIWYHAEIDAPKTLTGEANQPITTSINIKNASPRTWAGSGDFPIRVGARIINEQNKVVAEPRWQLGAPLRAGEQRQFDLTLTLPSQQGNYQVNWDLVEEKITWFGKVTGENVQTTAHITGSASAYYAPSPSLPSQAVTATFLPPDLSRLQLWKLAFQMWRAAPLLGVGLDNFRLTYGTQLGQTRWNDTLHTNNWYVETLVSFGLLAGLTFFAGQAFLLLDVAKSLINFQVSPFQLAIACAITAFYIHGLLDYFLLFNATGLLFWLLVGCWLIFHNKETRLNDQL